jgi:hypothetical protein
MALFFAVLVVAGIGVCFFARVWARRTRLERTIWRATDRNTEKVAVVLELDELVYQIGKSSPPPQ